MSEILERLRGYNPPDRTSDDQRKIAVDISDAADEIAALRAELETYRADHEIKSGNRALLRARVAELEAALREIRDEPIHHGYSDHAALVTQLQRWARAALAAKEPAPGEVKKENADG